MEQTKEKIISLFKEKGYEISTSEIAAYVYKDYISKPKNKDEKRKVAEMHRKLLHHINALVRSNILVVSKHGEKGQKYFSLNLDDGEEITEIIPKYKKRIIINRPQIPVMPIEGYEQQGIILKFEAETWVDRINSVVVKCSKINSIEKLKEILDKTFPVINDALCLEDFDALLTSINGKEFFEFIKKLNKESEDYGKTINCIINIENLDREKFIFGMKKILASKIKNTNFIYNIDSEIIQEHLSLFNEIVGLCINNKHRITLKNKRVQKSPIFFGRAGPYSFSEREWNQENNCIVLACSQAALTVDVQRFHSLYGLDIKKFSELMMNISKTFLSVNALQRKKSFDYFREIMELNHPNEKDFLESSRNYIRFWNYGSNQPGIDQEHVLNMISESKKKIDELAIGEETIYKSCGMPTRFKIALSCAFQESENTLSPAKYKKIVVNGLENLYNKTLKREITNREKVTMLFNGGDDLSFHRSGELSIDEIIREISVILNTYKFPIFSYSFENIKGNAQLTQYLK